ncbi:response regulator transcription factor [Gilvimarinus agarilyticus]|uniref:LuxR C-terminal-related transcriptional regulator n=1 Tax=unclassified Gilvimarinus TaxID=2642066 RepID=UPI001C0A29CE|nr:MULTISPECIES: response regulator transcription factor [unclassified Gilvimarinus]MBU2887769.1 response regulator transcription factor [Gilvimarinus agarilyticus]MDO6572408.1 response regulator transcription factor [Gilvimarinus sp. 2_MG-2023]MDO6746553.1 response regulator transcription factor [Gilvimarinus sp. 1_MG-2023]
MSLTTENILIIEDMAETCDWLASIVVRVFPRARIHKAAYLQQARELLKTVSVDLALLDIHLPDGNGLTLLQEAAGREIYWVVTTAFADDDFVFDALRQGARGYVLKEQSAEQLARHLAGIAEGQPPLSPRIAQRVLAYFQPQPAEELTARELQVLTLIAKGLPLKVVGEALCISTHTVGDHVKHIYRKLRVHSRAEAAIQAERRGLISHNTP